VQYLAAFSNSCFMVKRLFFYDLLLLLQGRFPLFRNYLFLFIAIFIVKPVSTFPQLLYKQPCQLAGQPRQFNAERRLVRKVRAP